jgi:hypothetical protein
VLLIEAVEVNGLGGRHEIPFLVSQPSEDEAFLAMSMFLNEYYKRAGDDMVTLLYDLTIEADGTTHDPAAWDDWLRCVRSVKAQKQAK